MNLTRRLTRFRQQYRTFVEKQGFPIIMTACIAVIVGSALWAGRQDETLPVPTPPIDEVQYAARLQQESLASAATPAPSPESPAKTWLQPLEHIVVLQGFDVTRLKQSAVTGVWRVHDAIDLKADIGSPVRAMADGAVQALGDESTQGAWVTIDHGEDTLITYAGMSELAGLRTGDPVDAGQTVGFAGNEMADETDLGPHLHLRIVRSGQAADPLLFLVP